ncbi:MAG: acetyl-CoA decarbonylase/synthase complex subunit delta [bacterium]
MTFVVPKEQYNGKINPVEVGRDGKNFQIGGSEALPFLSFEGKVNTSIPVALEIADIVPDDWPENITKHYKDVISDPAKWARFCQDEFKPDMICLRLLGTHPDRGDKSPEEARKTVESVLSAVSIPLIVFGSNSVEKDTEVMKACSEPLANTGSIIGKAQEKNYKVFAAVANAFNLKLVALSDLDINLSKQLNILLTQSGFDGSNIIIDAMPSTLGYGLEYTYSVMERIRLAALQQNDGMMQMPIIADVGDVTWKVKEAKAGQDEQPAWGNPERRGPIWETITAMAFVMAGGDLVVVRHPNTLKNLRNALGDLA